MKQGFYLVMTLMLLVACSLAVDQKEGSLLPQEEMEEEEIVEGGIPKEEYSFSEFMEDRAIEPTDRDIPYYVGEEFAGERLALKGQAQLSRYYGDGYLNLEETHFVIKVTTEEFINWHLYVPRQEFPELFKELKKGLVDIYADATISADYYKIDQGRLALAEEIYFKENQADEQPLDEAKVKYMKKHSVQLSAIDVLFDRRNMSNQPFALSGEAQLMSYARINSEYRDLEPTHFVLNLRDPRVEYEQIWRVALDRVKYRDLYEKALEGMDHVTLTAIIPKDCFGPRDGLAAIGHDAEYVPFPEKYVLPSDQALAYMEEKEVSLTNLEVLFNMSAHAGEAFLVEGSAKLNEYLPIGYEDLQDYYFSIKIVEDPYGDQYTSYPRTYEGWDLIMHRKKYPHIYERLIHEEQLDVMVIARVAMEYYASGFGGGDAFVEDIVVIDP
ncbi:hypothetical protein [Sutcliffiella rhizosphaerae]|uniref:Uncharacterized protein n=1 Tax=Sutcliffiella rhizosphaerae TaxID=2880967 RepID=A0ABM8YMK5_9BACI|nr:hypothetical protein [Sutcliffiella rhizosphaerae]CAG9621229.1 hypothetical protein BACCIP111883_02001 [Sutcliffiella rhizosphaerae]